MSNNKQDEPDEYDVIFGSSNSDSDKDTTIEVSDGEALKPQEYADVEPGFIDAEPAYVDPDHKDDDDFAVSPDAKDSTENDDNDIEDGIFAPVRKERASAKKSTSLMWAVSLLALVGVGSVVYVSNPDILNKITQNIDSDDVTVPNELAFTEEPVSENAATSDTSSTAVATVQPENEPVMPIADNADTTEIIHPNTHQVEDADVENAGAAVASQTLSVSPTQEQPVDMTANVTTGGTIDGATPTPLLGSEETANNVSSNDHAIEAATVAAVSAATDEPTTASVTSLVPETPVNTASEAEGKQAEMASAPIEKEAETPVAGVVTPPANEAGDATTPNVSITPDVIAPTNDTYEDSVEANAAATASVAAPEQDVVAAEKAAAELAAKQRQEAAAAAASVAATAEQPVVRNSAEEQQRLNDANLDQYFDSPSGNILNMLPAPSMDAKKGSNESIIIVNKKGSKPEKTKTSTAASSKHVKIETTTLDTQLVAANRALKLGRYEAAKEMYDELYKLNPRDPQILSGRAVLLQKMGFADQAINAYEELLKLYPDNADAIINWSGLIRKQYPAVALNKLLDLHIAQPQNALVTAQLGVANADAGNFGDAIRYLNDAAAIDSKNPLHFYNLAIISEKAGQRQQAVGYYEKALEVDAIYSEGTNRVPREKIYDRLAQIRGN